MNLEYAPNENDYFGHYQGIPIVLHILGHESETHLVRFRINSSQEAHPIELSSGYRMDIEKHYAFLTVNTPDALNLSSFMSLLDESINRLQIEGYLAKNACHMCKEVKPTTLTYDSGSIANVCEDCLQDLKLQQEDNQRANIKRDWPLVPTVIVTGSLLALFWMFAWRTYDWFFASFLGGQEEIWVLDTIVALIAGAFCLLVIVPVMFAISQTRLSRSINGRFVTAWMIVWAIMAGELLYLVVSYQTVNPTTLLMAVFTQGIFYNGLKLAILIALLFLLTYFNFRQHQTPLNLEAQG